jgi:hypothetical protein
MQRILLETMLSVKLGINDFGIAKLEGNAMIEGSRGVARPCVKKTAKLAELAKENRPSGRILAT